MDSKIEEYAKGLGLMDIGLERDVSELSGGQRAKILLAKELLENYLIHPTSNASSSTQVNTLQGQILDLTMKLKVEEMQCMTLSMVFMAQEEKIKAEIEQLTKVLNAYEQEAKSMPEMEPQQYPPQVQMPIQEEEIIGEEEPDEGGPTQEEEHLKVTKFTALEEDLKIKIQQEMDPIAKANMEWELRIIHSGNMHFFQYGDAYYYYHLPALPLPLLEMES